MDHILWPRRWTLIKEEIEHHRVSGRAEVEVGQGVHLLVLVASCRGWVRQCILLGNSGVHRHDRYEVVAAITATTEAVVQCIIGRVLIEKQCAAVMLA